MATQKNGKSNTRKVSAGGKAKTTRAKPAAKKAPAKKPATKKAAPVEPRLDDGQRSLLTGIIVLFLTAVLTLSLLSPNQGQFTQLLSRLAGLALGLGRFALPLISGAIGGYLVLRGMEQEPPVPSVRLAGLAIVFVVFLALAALVAYQRDESYVDLYAVAAAGAGGGYVGSVIATALGRLLGGLGTIVTLVVVGTAGGVLLSGLSREQVAGWLEREPRPSTGAEPATNGRTIRINPGRTATADQRPPTADHRPPATDQPALPLGPAVTLKPAKEPKRERGKKAADAVPPPRSPGTSGPRTASPPPPASDGSC